MMLPLILLALGFDWDEILMIVTAGAAFAYVVSEYRRDRLDRDLVIGLVERIARLEANHDDSIALESRIRDLEIKAERDDRVEERLAGLQERLAVAETRIEVLRESVAEGSEESNDEIGT